MMSNEPFAAGFGGAGHSIAGHGWVCFLVTFACFLPPSAFGIVLTFQLKWLMNR
jgi:hypothetical protein